MYVYIYTHTCCPQMSCYVLRSRQMAETFTSLKLMSQAHSAAGQLSTPLD